MEGWTDVEGRKDGRVARRMVDLWRERLEAGSLVPRLLGDPGRGDRA